MRYTRLEPVRKAVNLKIKILIGFIIVIPVTAIFVGSIVTRLLIFPYVIKSGSVSPLNKAEESAMTFKKKEISVYLLQVGAFANPDNANVLKKAILDIGVKASVINDNKIYRVIADIDYNKDSIIKTKDKLSKSGYECLVNEIEIKFEGKNKDLDNYLNSVVVTLCEQIKIEEKFSETGIESLKKGILGIEKNYSLVMDSEIYSKKGKEICAFNKELLSLINGYLKEYEMKGGNSLRYTTEEIFLIKNFNKFIGELEVDNSI